MRVVFVTLAILGGGIDRALATLAEGLSARGHEVSVATFFGGEGAFDDRVRAVATTFDANVRNRWDLVRAAGRTATWIRGRHPDVVHGLNVESNLVALLGGRLARARVVWGIRWADPGALAVDRRGRAARRLHARLARAPQLVIANSHTGGHYARLIGVEPERLRVIPNGVDGEEFRPDPQARARIRGEWNLADDSAVVAAVGLDPCKRPAAFLHAARAFADLQPLARFVVVGDHESRPALESLAQELGIYARVVWSGQRYDMREVYNACDVVSLLSTEEGTPNTVLEAMACEVPCVVTEAGDAPLVVGDPRLVVDGVAPDVVAAAWLRALDVDGHQLRTRVLRDFGLERLFADTERALLSLL